MFAYEPESVPAIESLHSDDGWFIVALERAQAATKATVEVLDAEDVRASTTLELEPTSPPAAADAAPPQEPAR